MNPRKYTQGIVTHPDGHKHKTHVVSIDEHDGKKRIRTGFGTFTNDEHGVLRWLAGRDFTLTIEEESNPWPQMNDEIQGLINRSIPPSFTTRAVICGRWDKARECLNCNRIGYILDVPLRGPCPVCGSNHINEITARWVNLRPWWKFWGPSGYWQKLEQ